MGDLAGDGMSNIIAMLALILTLVSFAVNLGITLLLDAKTRDRESRVEKATAYLSLELASIEVFKFKAAHFDAIEWARGEENSGGKTKLQLIEEADAFFYQCLNLFEVASRFRKDGIIVPQVYASWVAWFYETLEFPYFRKRWVIEYRDNYTPEVRQIFDSGVRLDWGGGTNNARREAFYMAVGRVLDCDVIKGWRVPVAEDGPPDESLAGEGPIQ